MRPVLLVIAMLSMSCVLTAPSFALQAEDTMQAWKGASDQERSELLEQILGKGVSGSANISRCMNATSTTPGHSDLSIGEVAKVCALPENAGQPV